MFCGATRSCYSNGRYDDAGRELNEEEREVVEDYLDVF
jgi:hypothetical protein